MKRIHGQPQAQAALPSANIKHQSSQNIFVTKSSNIKFNQNPSSVGRLVPCGKADERTEKTNLRAIFHSFANAPKIKQ